MKTGGNQERILWQQNAIGGTGVKSVTSKNVSVCVCVCLDVRMHATCAHICMCM